MAIVSFACKETEKLWNEKRTRIASEIHERALLQLSALDACDKLEDMRVPPSNHLEALKGSRNGQHSVRINAKWRICFRFANGNASNVEIVDYH